MRIHRIGLGDGATIVGTGRIERCAETGPRFGGLER